MKALRIGIFKNNGADYSNGGISSKYDDILLVCDDGNIEVDETQPLPENLCKVVERKLFGSELYYHVEPYNKPPKGYLGWMHGGCLVSTSDSRFKFNALKLHDRCETQAQYNALSH